MKWVEVVAVNEWNKMQYLRLLNLLVCLHGERPFNKGPEKLD